MEPESVQSLTDNLAVGGHSVALGLSYSPRFMLDGG
jgi:hypothetical protein